MDDREWEELTEGPGVVSHWHHLAAGLEQSSKEFYDALAKRIDEQKMPGVQLSRAHFAEGAVLSAKREYLCVRKSDLAYYICAAPFGTSYFFSSWLIGNTGCLAMLSRIPVIGWPILVFIRRVTFYSVDSAIMFQEAMHATVIAQVDEIVGAHNLKPLESEQRKPVLGKFFRR